MTRPARLYHTLLITLALTCATFAGFFLWHAHHCSAVPGEICPIAGGRH